MSDFTQDLKRIRASVYAHHAFDPSGAVSTSRLLGGAAKAVTYDTVKEELGSEAAELWADIRRARAAFINAVT